MCEDGVGKSSIRLEHECICICKFSIIIVTPARTNLHLDQAQNQTIASFLPQNPCVELTDSLFSYPFCAVSKVVCPDAVDFASIVWM